MATERSNDLLKSLMDIAATAGPGGRFPATDELCRRFDTSRTMMRESLAIMEFLGVIEVRPKTGARVRPTIEWYALPTWMLDLALNVEEAATV